MQFIKNLSFLIILFDNINVGAVAVAIQDNLNPPQAPAAPKVQDAVVEQRQ